MIVFTLSELTNVLETENIDNINIIYQYFIHPNKERYNEIKKCLKFNAKNKYITKIYLLNEKIYTTDQLGVSSDKIVQIDIKNRLKFKDVFDFINNNNISGYNIIINSDIFFDDTIKNLYKSDIHINKKMYAQIRYEYDNMDNTTSKINEFRGDMQDTWIIHSNFNIKSNQTKIFNFEFGKPGCDNKLIYLMSVLGYEVINDPEYIKTYHVHSTNIRNYSAADSIGKPYEVLMPRYFLEKLSEQQKMLYIDKYNHKKSNIVLFEYIKTKIENNQNFIIPRVAGIENNFAIFPVVISNKLYNDQILYSYLNNYRNTMKNNAGINLLNDQSVINYSQLYLEAFANCEIYSSWAPFDSVYQSLNYGEQNNQINSHHVIDNIFHNKQTIYAEVFDIYHYIYNTPWTHALKGKRILFVSNFNESITSKINNRSDIYGIDLFPECHILTIKPPQTQGTEESEDFLIELNKFTNKLDLIKDNYDIALVSCGGYGNLVCSHIYKSGKSAIYVGGVLQMYFGILGNRWFENRPDIIRLFLNKSWSRALESEKPKNFNNIERSCYW
jgi:hypothetical protein